MTCRGCKYLNVPPDKAGRIIPRKGAAYKCLAPEPELPLLPAACRDISWPPRRRYMESQDGNGCPLFEQRKKES